MCTVDCCVFGSVCALDCCGLNLLAQWIAVCVHCGLLCPRSVCTADCCGLNLCCGLLLLGLYEV